MFLRQILKAFIAIFNDSYQFMCLLSIHHIIFEIQNFFMQFNVSIFMIKMFVWIFNVMNLIVGIRFLNLIVFKAFLKHQRLFQRVLDSNQLIFMVIYVNLFVFFFDFIMNYPRFLLKLSLLNVLIISAVFFCLKIVDLIQIILFIS